jgi:hypothetical protein
MWVPVLGFSRLCRHFLRAGYNIEKLLTYNPEQPQDFAVARDGARINGIEAKPPAQTGGAHHGFGNGLGHLTYSTLVHRRHVDEMGTA